MFVKGVAAASLVLLLGMGPCIAASPSPADAGGVASAFYTLYLQTRPGGVPNATARGRFASLVTRRLLALLKAADAAETRYAKATRGKVPPLFEGDLFTSLFEGANSFTPQACIAGNAKMACAISLGYG